MKLTHLLKQISEEFQANCIVSGGGKNIDDAASN
jgi:phosphoribosylformimino-5-aminoimidazole carboxamide ribonucleotide (ProFAR) isomerase